MAYPPISPFPPAPSEASPETFSVTADAFLDPIPDFCPEVNAFGDYVDDANATIQYLAAIRNAELTQLVGVYSGGTTYQPGQCVFYNGGFYVALNVLDGTSLKMDFISGNYIVQSGLPKDGADWKQIWTIDGGFF